MTMETSYDAIVVGGGHNGLAAAATLARQKRRVLVVERRDTVGGMATTAEIAPGVRASRIAHLLYNLNPAVARELSLEAHGLTMAAQDMPTVSLAPDGRHVVTRGSEARLADGSAHPDAASYARVRERLVRFASLLAPLLDRTPPNLSGGGFSRDSVMEIGAMAGLGLSVRRLGKVEMEAFLHDLLSNVFDLVTDEMADGPLAGVLGADAVLGGWAGPRSPGTVLSLMYRLAQGGAPALPAGGMGAVTAALSGAAAAAGVEIATGTGVRRILVDGDRARGVLLQDGRRIGAGLVLCSVGAGATMGLAGVEHFDAEAVRRIRHVRARGTAAKVNLVLSQAPRIDGLGAAETAGRILLAPSLDHIERAFNPAKYGEMSKAPLIEFVVPTLSDDTLAPAGTHVLSAVVQYAPYALAGGWTEAAKARLLDLTLDALSPHLPGLRDAVTAADVMSPADIEAETGAPGGHWHHGELSVDQMLMLRPVNGMGRYASGVPGLYLCGAGAHPGGDVTGAAGRNAALQAMKDGVAA